MNALDALPARAQAGFETSLIQIAATLRARFGAAAFEGVSVEAVAEIMTGLLEREPASAAESRSAPAIQALSALEWWCGLEMPERVKARLGRLLRRDYRLQVESGGFKRPKPDVACRRSHVVFVGPLGTPLHSPTVGAVGYLKALAADPKNRRIEVWHNGAINPELVAYIQAELPATAPITFRSIEEHPDFLALAVMRAPCTYHFWCYPRMNVDYSLLAMFGPTVMFTCADDAPLQYADVYWYPHAPEHIERAWPSAPASFRANYAYVKSADFPLAAAGRARSKAEFGLGEDELLLASVGNRLSVDIDEPFLAGVRGALKGRPDARWLLVGGLSGPLLESLGRDFGPQLLHLPSEPALGGLMAACDLWINPFRKGGGNSAIIAAAAGAPVLTRGDMGDVPAWVPAEHWAADEADYFARLDRLMGDAVERAAWARAQQAFVAARLDPKTYTAELDRIVALAFERFKTRARASMEAIFPEGAVAAAA